MGQNSRCPPAAAARAGAISPEGWKLDPRNRQSDRLNGCVVQLRHAPLPYIFGAIADHYWFVVFDADSGASRRWEVWHVRNAGGRSIGHVHCDLLPPDADVGGGPMQIAREWRGAEASALREVLERPADYPHCERYHYWPGPNSNTFAAWVLREAGIEHPFHWRAIGSHYGRSW